MTNKAFIVLAVLALLFTLLWVGYNVHVHRTCDGAVVKNTFDWPTCVAGGN